MEVVNQESGKYGECYFDNLSLEISSFCAKPEKYLEPTDSMRKELLSLSKKMYDLMKDYEIYSNQNSLSELLVNGFDNEQVWQEIQLQNNTCLPKFRGNVKGFTVDNVCFSGENKNIVEKQQHKKKKKKKFDKSKKTKGEEAEQQTEDLFEDEEFSDGSITEKDENEIKEPRKKYKSTIVDDNFFQLREMEEYMEKLDQLEGVENGDDNNENNKSDGGIDFFKEDLESSDEEKEEKSISHDSLQYNDFFDPPATSSSNKSKKPVNKNDDDDNDDEDNGDDDDDGMDEEDMEEGEEEVGDEEEEEELNDDEEEEEEVGAKVLSDNLVDEGKTQETSTFERKQKQMQEKIKKLEEENLREKPWQLMGETSAKKRPVNSLLEEFVTFDHTSVGAPVVTEETTLSLEDLIKQRIKDQAWDDVLRKEKPVVQPFEYKRAPELNMEKSKLSLAEVYEKEYMKQTDDDKEEKENEEHVKIEKLMDRLFVQLNALSNFHFTPKPPRPEIKVITNAPSLQMEEILPITMTEASQLAPEEVFEKKKGEIVGAEEKTDEDRKRERRQKKIKKKFAVKAKENREKLKGQKSGKIAKSDRKQAMDSLKKNVRTTIVNGNKSWEKNVKSSNEFFNKLQDEVKKKITKESMKGKKREGKTKKSAEFLKL